MSEQNKTSALQRLTDEPASPCIGLCEVDPKHMWCLGCYRKLDEITDWFKFEDDKKREILTRIAERKASVGDAD